MDARCIAEDDDTGEDVMVCCNIDVDDELVAVVVGGELRWSWLEQELDSDCDSLLEIERLTAPGCD